MHERTALGKCKSIDYGLSSFYYSGNVCARFAVYSYRKYAFTDAFTKYSEQELILDLSQFTFKLHIFVFLIFLVTIFSLKQKKFSKKLRIARQNTLK